jgi:predicted RNA-binding protein with PUA-like domain
MKIGDLAFFYHSNCKEPGIVGIMKVCKLAYPDKFQFKKGHKYFDSKSDPKNPRWLNVDMEFIKKTSLVSLSQIRDYPELSKMKILQKGNRLSITPVTRAEWDFINKYT